MVHGQDVQLITLLLFRSLNDSGSSIHQPGKRRFASMKVYHALNQAIRHWRLTCVTILLF